MSQADSKFNRGTGVALNVFALSALATITIGYVMTLTRQGQSCTAGSRLFVHEDVYDDFLKVLVQKVGALKVGDPLEEATDMGSIISEVQYKTVCDYVADGKRH